MGNWYLIYFILFYFIFRKGLAWNAIINCTWKVKGMEIALAVLGGTVEISAASLREEVEIEIEIAKKKGTSKAEGLPVLSVRPKACEVLTAIFFFFLF